MSLHLLHAFLAGVDGHGLSALECHLQGAVLVEANEFLTFACLLHKPCVGL